MAGTVTMRAAAMSRCLSLASGVAILVTLGGACAGREQLPQDASVETTEFSHKGVDLLVHGDAQEVFSAIGGTVTRIGHIYEEGPGSLGSGDDVIFQYVEVTDADVRVRHLYVDPMIEVGSVVEAGGFIGHAQSLKSRYSGVKNQVHVEAEVQDDQGHWITVDPTEWLGL